jgi:hypothetical protein
VLPGWDDTTCASRSSSIGRRFPSFRSNGREERRARERSGVRGYRGSGGGCWLRRGQPRPLSGGDPEDVDAN